jgi:hypothetical protein
MNLCEQCKREPAILEVNQRAYCFDCYDNFLKDVGAMFRTLRREGSQKMSTICRKHKKEKTENWMEKQRHGGLLMRIGCVDCKAAARGAPPRPASSPQPPRRPV